MDGLQLSVLPLCYLMKVLVTINITKSMGGPAILLQQEVGCLKHLASFKLLSIQETQRVSWKHGCTPRISESRMPSRTPVPPSLEISWESRLELKLSNLLCSNPGSAQHLWAMWLWESWFISLSFNSFLYKIRYVSLIFCYITKDNVPKT